MKINKKILIALMLAGLSTATIAEEKDIKIMVKDVDGVVTKTVTVNGTELNPEEIAELEASGEIKIIHLDGIDAEIGDTITLMNVGDDNFNSDKIEIMLNTDGDETTKTVIMNGKKLSAEEISELEANGQLHTFEMNVSGQTGQSLENIMIFNTDDEGGISKKINVIAKSIQIDDDSATLGFMTSIKKDGWHVISVVEGSGAEEVGLKPGDIIKFMGEKDLSDANIDNLSENLEMTRREVGEMVDLEVERDGKLLYFSVEARKNNSFDMVMDVKVDGHNGDFSWVDDLKNVNNMIDGKNVKVMVMNSKLGNSLNFDNVDVNLPEILGNMNIFITDGNSTSKLLGKGHEMSSLSSGLESYFGTNGGVLLMHIDGSNAFGLQDGDVIKSISGNKVNTPKDVIKQLLKADKQEDIKLKIVRHKRNKTLKYNK